MPTFPLLDLNPPHPDGWHAVTAPGGYESWRFEAEDLVNHRQLVATFYDGCPLHPGYLQADARYRHDPTHVPPAVPNDFPAVHFALFESGRVRGQFLAQFPRSEIAATRDRLEVTIGSNRIVSDSNEIHLSVSGTPWELGWNGPRVRAGTMLSAQLQFRILPTPPISQRQLIATDASSAAHYWELSAPRCDVSGSVNFDGETIAFRGRGYHDHHFGTTPLDRGFKRVMHGRVLSAESTIAFHLAEPADSHIATELHLLRITAQDVEESIVLQHGHFRERRTRWGLAFPTMLELNDQLRLSEPRVVESSPLHLRLHYAVQTPTTRGRAFCELIYPQRLRRPLVAWMVEQAIDRSTCTGK